MSAFRFSISEHKPSNEIQDTSNELDINLSPNEDETKEETVKDEPIDNSIDLLDEEKVQHILKHITKDINEESKVESNDENNIKFKVNKSILQKAKRSIFPAKIPHNDIKSKELIAFRIIDEKDRLSVVSYMPSGNIRENFKNVIIKFSHEISKNVDTIPFIPTINPNPPEGEWKVGFDLKSIIFTLNEQCTWTKSTEYTVTVPSSVKLNGKSLSEDYHFTFRTPTINIVKSFPPNGSPQSYSSTLPILVVFDQKIDKEYLSNSKTLSLITKKQNVTKFEFLSKEKVTQISNEKGIKEYINIIESVEDDYWICVQPKETLIRDIPLITLTFKDVKSLEGSLLSKPKQVQFKVIQPFMISSSNITSQSLNVYFTNDIVKEESNENYKWIPDVSPDLPSGRWIAKNSQLTYQLNEGSTWTNSTRYLLIFDSKMVSSSGEPLYKNEKDDLDLYRKVTISTANNIIRFHSLHLTHRPLWIFVFSQRIDRQRIVDHFKIIKRKNYGKKDKKTISVENVELDELNIMEFLFYSKYIDFLTNNNEKYVLFKSSTYLKDSTEYTLYAHEISSAEGPNMSTVSFYSYFTTQKICNLTDINLSRSTTNPESISFIFDRDINDINEENPYYAPWVPIFTPAPPLGVWYHPNNHTLVFKPSKPWQLSTEYKISLPENARSKYESKINFECKNDSFSTSLIKLDSILSISNSPSATVFPTSPYLTLKFTQPVDREKTFLNIKVRDKKKNKYPVTLCDIEAIKYKELKDDKDDNLDHLMLIKIEPPLKPESNVYLTLSEIIPKYGNLSYKIKEEHTIFVLKSFKVESLSFANSELKIVFTQKIALSNNDPIPFRPKIKPSPPKGHWIVSPYQLTYIPFENAAWDFGSEYNVEIKKGIKSYYDDELTETYTGTFTPNTSHHQVIEKKRMFTCKLISPVTLPSEHFTNNVQFKLSFDLPLLEDQDFSSLITVIKKGEKKSKPLNIQWILVDEFTVQSEHEVKLCKSSQYKIKVNESISSENGEKLGSNLSFEFQTPTNRVIESYPPTVYTNTVNREPLFFLRFSQPITDNIMNSIKLFASKKKNFSSKGKVEYCSLERVNVDELNYIEDITILKLLKKYHDKKDRIIVLKPTVQLISKQDYILKVGPNIESREGKSTFNRKTEIRMKYSDEFKVVANKINDTTVDFIFNQHIVPLDHDKTLKSLPWMPKINQKLQIYHCAKWTIVNHHTLRFSAKSIPSGNHFTLTIPAGIKSMIGMKLKNDYNYIFNASDGNSFFRFVKFSPSYGYCHLAIEFNHFIVPKDVIKYIKIFKGNTLVSNLELLGPHEVFKVDNYYISEGRSLLCKTTSMLPPSSKLQIKILKGFKTADGSVPNKEESYSIKTMKRFKIKRCKTVGTGSVYVYFNYPLKNTQNYYKAIKITPEVHITSIRNSGSVLYIRYIPKTFNEDTQHQLQLANWIETYDGTKLYHEDEAEFSLKERIFTFKTTAVAFNSTIYTGLNDKVVTMNASSFQNSDTIPFYLKSFNYTKYRAILYRVDPLKHYSKFINLSVNYKSENPVKFGEKVYDEIVEIEDFMPDNKFVTYVNLAKAFKDEEERIGHILLIAFPTPESHYPNKSTPPIVETWIQLTNLAVDVFSTHDGFNCYTSDIKSGKPIDNVMLYFNEVDTKSFKSIEESSSCFTSFKNDLKGNLLAIKDNDSCIVPSINKLQKSAYDHNYENQYFWHVFDDRSLYKPKETVHIKGYIRMYKLESNTLKLSMPSIKQFEYTVNDPLHTEIVRGTFEISDNGSFSIKFDLNEDINLGSYTVNFGSHVHHFQVQEFKTPQFESRINVLSTNPILYKSNFTVKSENIYYSGGYIDNCNIKWEVLSNKGTYTPPGLSGYIFSYTPITSNSNDSIYTHKQSLQLVTNEIGESAIDIVLGDNPSPPSPISLHIQTETTNIDSNSSWAQKLVIVHPSKYYVGLKCENFKIKGPTYVNVVVVDLDGNFIPDIPVHVDVYGKVNANYQVNSEVIKSFVIYSSNKPVRFPINRFEDKIGESLAEMYQIVAKITDFENRTNEASISVADPYYDYFGSKLSYFNGSKGYFIQDYSQESEILVSLDKDEYKIGEEVSLFIPIKSSKARGILHVVNILYLKSIEFEVTNENPITKFKVEKSFVPGVKLFIKIFEEDNDETKVSNGMAFFKASYENQNIDLYVEPEDKIVTPGGKTNILVEVKNALNYEDIKSCEVTVFVVDEAVLALAGYEMKNPLSVFYSPDNFTKFFLGLQHNSVRQYILQNDFIPSMYTKPIPKVENHRELVRSSVAKCKGRSRSLKEKKRRKCASNVEFSKKDFIRSSPSLALSSSYYEEESEGYDEEEDFQVQAKEDKITNILTRTNFNPLALFSPHNKLDKDGKLRLELDLPDNLTRYRIYAVAALGSEFFGLSESLLTSTLPLQIKVTAPKVLNFRDECSFPVVIQNLVDEEMEIQVGVKVKNAKILGNDNIGYIVRLMPMTRKVIFVPLFCDTIGKVTIQVIAMSQLKGDSQEITIDVLKPPTTEGFVKSGSLSKFYDASIINLNIPDDCLLDLGTLKISQASTNIHDLFSPYYYMMNNNIQLVEPMASKLLTIAASMDHLKAFKVKDFDESSAKDEIKFLVKTLSKRRTRGGGFSMWGTDYSLSHAFITAHAVHALSLCKKEVFSLFTVSWKNEKEYLKRVMKDEQYSPIERIYSLYALAKLDKNKKYMKIAEDFADVVLDKYSIEIVGLLLSVLSGSFFSTDPSPHAKILVNYLETRISDCDKDDLNPYSEHILHNIFYSSIRSNAIILEALCLSSPESPLIPKLLKFIMKNRVNDAWSTSQENAWAAVALSTYFKKMESNKPSFTSFIWINKIFGGQFKFDKRDTSTFTTDIPLSKLNEEVNDENVKEIDIEETTEEESNEGYDDEDTEEYVDKDLDNQIIIYKNGKGRLYYQIRFDYTPTTLACPSLNEGFRVERNYYINNGTQLILPNDEGIYMVPKNETVDVVIKIKVDGYRKYAAILDRLPGGLEPVFPQEIEKTWFNHYNIFTKGAEIYCEYLLGGEYEFIYKAKATTSGRFLVSPCTAEELYSPDIRGRTSSSLFLIK